MWTAAIWVSTLFFLVVCDKLPGGRWFWLALAALAIAISAFVAPDSDWPYQGGVFLIGVGGRLLWWRWKVEGSSIGSVYDNKGSGQVKMVGKVLTLTRDIKGGRGGVTIKGDPWQVRGPDLPSGTKVRVVGLQGHYLQVEPAG